jgi:D-glycero-D-manno-heptose 1,7-bisphosphate phosphatase
MNKAIFLDRDGVINYDSPHYIKSPDEFHFIPGSIEAIVKLTQAGYLVGIATNQSGLSRGLYDRATLDAIHQRMCHAIEKNGGKIHHIEFCPHLPDTGCECRKPKPGMLINLAKKLGVNLSSVYFVGDKLTDVDAARAAGAKPIFILPSSEKSQEDVPTYGSLQDFVLNKLFSQRDVNEDF